MPGLKCGIYFVYELLKTADSEINAASDDTAFAAAGTGTL